MHEAAFFAPSALGPTEASEKKKGKGRVCASSYETRPGRGRGKSDSFRFGSVRYSPRSRKEKKGGKAAIAVTARKVKAALTCRAGGGSELGKIFNPPSA